MDPQPVTSPQFVRLQDLQHQKQDDALPELESTDSAIIDEPEDKDGALATAAELDAVEKPRAGSDNWDELHDILFRSVGLERVQFSLHYVKNRMNDGSTPEDELLREAQALSVLPAISELSSSVKETLVETYFRHCHPRCPAIDEVEFMSWLRTSRRGSAGVEDELMEMLLDAVLFSAFSHCTIDLLKLTPFESQKHGHKILFNKVRQRYHELMKVAKGSLALVQTALLLTIWSPYDSTREVNSYWVRQAFEGAVANGLGDASSTGRGRIVWWCCLIRNRMIALGLRRPGSLETTENGRLPTTADFGREAIMPWYQSTKAKKVSIRAFISLCELSGLMYDAMRLKTKAMQSGWWVNEEVRTNNQIDEVGVIDEKLVAWRRKFDAMCGKLQPHVLTAGEMVLLHLINMIHFSTVSATYEQCLRLDSASNTRLWMMRSLAIHKIKEASTNIALLCGSLLKHAKLEELPQTLGAWIILPIAVHLVQVNMQRGFEDEGKLKHLEYLMRSQHALCRRFEGSEFVTKVIDAIIHAFQSAKIEASIEVAPGPSLFPAKHKRLQAQEDELLLSVVDIIQQGLADEVVPKPHM